MVSIVSNQEVENTSVASEVCIRPAHNVNSRKVQKKKKEKC